MAFIKPYSELKNNYYEISKFCKEIKEPLYISNEGKNDLVVLSNEFYEELLKKCKDVEEEREKRRIWEKFNKHYESFEDFRNDIIAKIEHASQQIREGKGIPIEVVATEMEAMMNIAD